ncbi:MAG TPA: aspartate carbamoyltransferase catalytic subunit [Bacillota bacterium]|nr:aspartate carbamoyltransferase catalytic subunit [Bacillota bacterium]HOA14814.1 aspartate carbamoyltransferase catalytic subunit [Bacillota bacterium]
MAGLPYDLVSMEDLDRIQIEAIMARAAFYKRKAFAEKVRMDVLEGKTVATIFYEPSTRTRCSFELAAKYLGAQVINVDIANSSTVKGESLKDTGLTLQMMGVDLFIIRHQMSGASALFASYVEPPVINGGDGTHEHPTQALLDLMRMLESLGNVEGRRVAIIGDVAHSRVARSNAICLGKMGASVVLCAPPTLMPEDAAALGADVTYDMERALKGADVVMMLRVQLERQKAGMFPSVGEYHRLYGLTQDKLDRFAPGALVMHPAPMNRGVEIASPVADGPQSQITAQVTCGVAVRMALMDMMIGEGGI